MNNGVTVLVILIVPLMFQVFMLRWEQKKIHREMQERLGRIEEKLA
ncbi:MAG: hypothetical protein KAH56_08370 [Candidatus Krumholzibacteria bacterium]|nr:hypothetical protein [Candidatus Krumholzibacteria bacterium]